MKKTTKNNPTEAAFSEVVNLIKSARQQAFQAVNTTLIELYWQVGAYISRKIENAEWGDGVVEQLAAYSNSKSKRPLRWLVFGSSTY